MCREPQKLHVMHVARVQLASHSRILPHAAYIHCTCTKVVFPDPAIPRQMMQVGLSAKGVSGALELLAVLLELVSIAGSGIASAIACYVRHVGYSK